MEYTQELKTKYWSDKENRAEQAANHTDEMENKYKNNISRAVVRSEIEYGETCNRQTMKLVNEDSVSAAFNNRDGRTCILNFASYKNPGGGFLKGSGAQEESLCHESCLYNVLKQMQVYYDWNKEDLNKGLYRDKAIYSPGVIFEHNDKAGIFDVLTCAAPNYTTASKYCHVTLVENNMALKSRIRFILSVLEKHNVQTAILGAFGCGVFGQDAKVVASIFKEYLPFFNIPTVIMAVPGDDENYQKFKEVFGTEETTK